MNQKSKKIIAPIFITIIFCVYFVFWAFFIFEDAYLSIIAKILMAIVPLAFAAVNILVLIERIKEIRSGEEDDLSQY